MFKSGYIAVIGRSNVGKSTLLNRIVGEHLSIISSKPQTTRNKMNIIVTTDDYQAIFVDTPGVQKPKTKLGEYMLKVSINSLNDADVVTYIVDPSDYIGENEEYILRQLKKVRSPILLLINKSDLIKDPSKLESIKAMYEVEDIFHSIIAISALNGDGVNEYMQGVIELLPQGPLYYEEDIITDMPIRDIMGEIFREKALIFLREEIPHGISVEIEDMKMRSDKNLYDIRATLVVEKKSHKGMVIGKNGQMLKKISSAARKDMEDFLDAKVNLETWVKVDEDWRDKISRLKNYGYR